MVPAAVLPVSTVVRTAIVASVIMWPSASVIRFPVTILRSAVAMLGLPVSAVLNTVRSIDRFAGHNLVIIMDDHAGTFAESAGYTLLRVDAHSVLDGDRLPGT
jgi:hypothetical protein